MKLFGKLILLFVIIISSFVFFVFNVYRDVNFTKANQPDQIKNFQAEKNSTLQWDKEIKNGIIIFSSSETGYKLGLSKGEALQAEIKEIVNILNTEIFPENLSGGVAKIVSLFKAKQFWENIPAHYQLEIAGIAQGADVSINDILLINVFDDISNVLGCSSIVIPKGEKSEYLIHARNLDYNLPQLAGKNIVYIHQNESEEFQFLTVGFPGYVGALTGINSAGVSLTNHTSATFDVNLGEPTGFTYRRILEEANLISEVKEILEGTQKTQGNNLMVGSFNENKVSVFELTASYSEERYLMKSCLTTTNHFQSEVMQNRFKQFLGASKLRNEAMQNFCEKNKFITIEDVINLMSNYDPNLSGWQTLANHGTIQAVVMIPGLRQIYVANGDTPPVNQAGYVLIEY